MAEPQVLQIPDFVVREIGAQHLQVLIAQQRIVALEAQLAQFAATDPSAPIPGRAGDHIMAVE